MNRIFSRQKVKLIFAFLCLVTPFISEANRPDWLIDGSYYKATINISSDGKRLELTNGLLSRVILLTPNAATIAFDNLMTGQSELRAVRPEAFVVLDRKEYPVGGLNGQPVSNFLSEEFISGIELSDTTFTLADYKIEETQERFSWKPNHSWISNLYPWPAKGKRVAFTYKAPDKALPSHKDVAVRVIYELYDGAPILSKWIEVENKGEKTVTLDAFKSEILALNEGDAAISRHTGKPARTREEGSRFGVSPCIASEWGDTYFDKLTNFFTYTGMNVFEHDGSYPGDPCASTIHSGHHGYADSQWQQWKKINTYYRWCRSKGIYLNVPDWYFLSGSSKTPMGYVETNWSLPHAYQEVIERQNIYDGTWLKTPSMGYMFVPLTQYHGGGESATIEPLSEHLDHYETCLRNLFGAGVQACYRGPRLYDTEKTKLLVRQWVSFYKKYRSILDSDIIHLRRPDGRDWDGIMHVNPALKEKAFISVYKNIKPYENKNLNFIFIIISLFVCQVR